MFGLTTGSLGLVKDDGKPNLSELSMILRDMGSLKLTVKFFGYELARSLATALPVRERGPARYVGMQSKPSTQIDIQSDWVAHWCAELQIPVIFHRKLWELAYALQAVYEHGSMRPGARGLGFGCGVEPFPSYFASQGVDVLATDLDVREASSKGWAETNQHASSLDMAFHPHLVDRAVFDRHVTHRYLDMNAIDPALTGFDFCWSICAFEHLGSIARGMDFVRNSLATLRPGGLAVHTTEFNFTNDQETVDNWPTVLFQRRHFQELADRLTAEGHTVAPLDFNVGDMPLDKFVDVPPYATEWNPTMNQSWGNQSPHIKLSVDGFPSTCFGFLVTKAV